MSTYLTGDEALARLAAAGVTADSLLLALKRSEIPAFLWVDPPRTAVAIVADKKKRQLTGVCCCIVTGIVAVLGKSAAEIGISGKFRCARAWPVADSLVVRMRDEPFFFEESRGIAGYHTWGPGKHGKGIPPGAHLTFPPEEFIHTTPGNVVPTLELTAETAEYFYEQNADLPDHGLVYRSQDLFKWKHVRVRLEDLEKRFKLPAPEAVVPVVIPGRKRPPEGKREQQFRLMQAKAAELGIDLQAPKRGDKAMLRDALQSEKASLFSNWGGGHGIWQAAIDAGIVKPILSA